MSKEVASQSTTLGMGTEITHRVFGKYGEKALRAVEGEAVRLEQILNRFMTGSEISRINSSAGVQYEQLSCDTYEVLSRAIHYSSYGRGLFDVTVAPLVNLWNYKHSSGIPDEKRIRQVLPLVNYADLILDPREQTAGLQKKGQSVDLGGIGKGFASDRFIEVFRKFGVSSAFTNIGGNVAALGTRPDGSPWRVGIRHPRQEGSLIGVVSVADKAVVTSGDYQRYFVDLQGKRHHHILDPQTGYPAESGLISVTIVADSATAADALSTLVFVAGERKGLELLKNFPGTDAVLIDTDLRICVTQSLKDCFQTEKGIGASILN